MPQPRKNATGKRASGAKLTQQGAIGDALSMIAGSAEEVPGGGKPGENPGPAFTLDHDADIQRDIVVVDNRTLIGDCLAFCIETRNRSRVYTFTTVADWLADARTRSPGSVILSLGGSLQSPEAQSELEAVLAEGITVPIIIVCDTKHQAELIEVIERGVRGCIVTALPFSVALQAIRLVMAGGSYAPVSALLQHRAATAQDVMRTAPILTRRENEVLGLVCKGRTNQEVADSLNMRLSTVKVHVRNISKKFSTKNRTELAAIARRMRPDLGG